MIFIFPCDSVWRWSAFVNYWVIVLVQDENTTACVPTWRATSAPHCGPHRNWRFCLFTKKQKHWLNIHNLDAYFLKNNVRSFHTKHFIYWLFEQMDLLHQRWQNYGPWAQLRPVVNFWLAQSKCDARQVRRTDSSGCFCLVAVSFQGEINHTHPNSFILTAGSKCQTTFQILLIRNNCTEPTCAITCLLLGRVVFYKEQQYEWMKNIVQIVMIIPICCSGGCVIHANGLVVGNGPRVSQQWHLEVWYKATYYVNAVVSWPF